MATKVKEKEEKRTVFIGPDGKIYVVLKLPMGTRSPPRKEKNELDKN